MKLLRDILLVDYLDENNNLLVGFIKFIKHLLFAAKPYQKIRVLIRLQQLFALKENYKVAGMIENRIFYKFNCQISYKAKIGKNIILPHPIGIIIGEGVNIGENVVIYHNVTIGRKHRESYYYPSIGDNVIIYSNSSILGDIKINNRSIIGAHSLVLNDTDCNTISVGIPAKKINKQ